MSPDAPRPHGDTALPRIPPPRTAADDHTGWTPGRPAASAPPLPHPVLKSLLGAWALSACSAEETAAVEAHLTDCADCADEARRLREAVALLHPEDSLDLDPSLRSRVLAGALGRRPARVPVPDWAAPYEAETARLDALLRDIGEAEWRAPVRLTWFDGRRPAARDVTVADVINHLAAVDGLLTGALGLPDPLGAEAPRAPAGRTAAAWSAAPCDPPPDAIRGAWRGQSRSLIRAASFADGGVAGATVDYGALEFGAQGYGAQEFGDFALPLRDAFVDRAFECWTHAEDIAEAVDYPYAPPVPGHLHPMVDLAARLLPEVIAARRRAGLAPPAPTLVAAGAPGRTLHLEIEGNGGGHWYIPLDSPAARATEERTVAHVALDALEFCRLAAGHVPPHDAAAGRQGDEEAVRDVLYATASLSRM
ncbi:zf-HC2 domain-containing protein [Streptomyces sp. NPDC049577]|uniref:zf-HC2 domain-containing protein n=1 Tax=Streptomyces sp. NPDC049577 TaxID=3155153 RepID=UPI00343EEBD5